MKPPDIPPILEHTSTNTALQLSTRATNAEIGQFRSGMDGLGWYMTDKGVGIECNAKYFILYFTLAMFILENRPSQLA
jgi:hypothetical protein